MGEQLALFEIPMTSLQRSRAHHWGDFTAEEYRIAARVARASGGCVLPGAADAWDALAMEKEEDVRRLRS